MKTNTVIDISTPIPYLTKFWVSHYGPKCCQPMKLQVSLKCNISKKWMNFIFGIQINIQVFYKLILPFWLRITWHAQSTQNKFVYLCSYLMLFPEKHAVWNWFFACKKPKMFYKLIVSLWVYLARHAQSTQNNKFSISLQYLKENVKDKVDFCLLIIVKGFLKVILLF